MNNAMETPKVVGTFFQGLSQLLLSEGVDCKRFYGKFELSPMIETNAQELVSFEVFIDILNEIKATTSIKHPGLYLADFQIKHETFPYFNLVLSSPTFAVALQIARRFRYVYSEVAYWHMTVEDSFCVVKKHTFVPLEVNDREHCLYTVAKVFVLIRIVLGGSTKIERVSLVQPEDEYKYELEKFFNCPISFDQDFDGFIIKEKYLYKYQSNFDAENYHRLLEKFSHHKVVFPENQKFSVFVKSIILQILSTGHCSLNYAAGQIGMHPKAVQKRLLKENLTYKVLITNVRMSAAKRLLSQQDISLIHISSMLGYSEPSAFSRAFQMVNNCSPSQWRKSNKEIY